MGAARSPSNEYPACSLQTQYFPWKCSEHLFKFRSVAIVASHHRFVDLLPSTCLQTALLSEESSLRSLHVNLLIYNVLHRIIHTCMLEEIVLSM